MSFEKHGEKWVEILTVERERSEEEMYTLKEDLKSCRDLLERLNSAGIVPGEAGMLRDIANRLERGVTVWRQLEVIVETIGDMPDVPKPKPKDAEKAKDIEP